MRKLSGAFEKRAPAMCVSCTYLTYEWTIVLRFLPTYVHVRSNPANSIGFIPNIRIIVHGGTCQVPIYLGLNILPWSIVSGYVTEIHWRWRPRREPWTPGEQIELQLQNLERTEREICQLKTVRIGEYLWLHFFVYRFKWRAFRHVFSQFLTSTNHL